MITDPGECSIDCGGGTRIATIKCQPPIGELFEAADENECIGAGPKPDKVFLCNTEECVYAGISLGCGCTFTQIEFTEVAL